MVEDDDYRSDEDEGPYEKNIAFLAWMGFVFGFGGLHRLYLGQLGIGIVYLITWGFFGVGQIIDLVRLGRLVEERNAVHRALENRRARRQRLPHSSAPAPDPAAELEALRKELLRAASSRGGRLTVSQGVMATGKGFPEVEKVLDQMVVSGYVGVDNDEETGAVTYIFGDIA